MQVRYQAALRPDCKDSDYILCRRLLPVLPFEQVQYVLKFQPDLVYDLLTLGDILLGVLPGHLLPGATDRKPLFIKQAAYLAYHQHILALIIPTVSTPLDGF